MKKKLNNAGFTLIELLAVITIMGILMMVAIPSVSRTIENSRRDTFMDNALIYVDTVRTAVLSDEVTCGGVSASATANGTYYFRIDTSDQQTKDLMETVATSSWGGAQITGYVKWTKAASGERTTTTYSVCLADAGGHGMNAFSEESAVTRSKILTTGATCSPPSGTVCTLK